MYDYRSKFREKIRKRMAVNTDKSSATPVEAVLNCKVFILLDLVGKTESGSVWTGQRTASHIIDQACVLELSFLSHRQMTEF